MSRKNRKRSHKDQPESRSASASVAGVLEKAVDTGASLPFHPVRAWHNAEEGTQEFADLLPDMAGVNGVKTFIRRHPMASTCAALAVGYMVFRNAAPLLGRILRG